MGCVSIALASCATKPQKPVRIEQQLTSSKEIKRPITVRVESPGNAKTSGGGGQKKSHGAGQVEAEQGEKKQDFGEAEKPHDVTKNKEKMPGVGPNYKEEPTTNEGPADAGDTVEEGEPPEAVGVAGELWRTDQLVSKGWEFEQAGGILRVVKRDEPQGGTPGLFEDAIIQNRVRSVLIAAGHPEAAESVKVNGGVVAMVLDPKDGGERLLTAIEAAFSVVGVQRLEVSPRF